MQLNLSPIDKASEFLAAYQASHDSITHLAGQDDLEPRAQETASLWAAAARLCPSASLMVARSTEQMSIASHNGPVIIEARSKLNIGILRSVLKRVETNVIDHGPAEPILSDQPAQRIWAFLQRLDQIEAPRVFNLKLGDHQIFINAKKDMFEIVSDEAPGICVAEQMREAAAANREVSLTLDDDFARGEGHRNSLSDFLAPESDDANILWTIGPDGLPRHMPRGASFTDVAAASCLADAFRRWHAKTNGHVDLLNPEGFVILKLMMGPDNSTATMTTTEQFKHLF